jgi:hypothetical protein
MPDLIDRWRPSLPVFLGGGVLSFLSGLLLLVLYGLCLTNPASPTYYTDKLYMMWREAWGLVALAATAFVSGLTLMLAAVVMPLFRDSPDESLVDSGASHERDVPSGPAQKSCTNSAFFLDTSDNPS